MTNGGLGRRREWRPETGASVVGDFYGPTYLLEIFFVNKLKKSTQYVKTKNHHLNRIGLDGVSTLKKKFDDVIGSGIRELCDELSDKIQTPEQKIWCAIENRDIKKRRRWIEENYENLSRGLIFWEFYVSKTNAFVRWQKHVESSVFNHL